MATPRSLDVGVAAEQLQGDLLAAVADGEVDLAEPALADAALDRVAVERPLPGTVGEPHVDRPSLGAVRRRFIRTVSYSPIGHLDLAENPFAGQQPIRCPIQKL